MSEVQPSVKIHASSGDDSSVDAVSARILRSEMHLQRFNLNCRVNIAQQGRWKGWRFFVSQEGALCGNAAANITGTANRFDHIHGLDNVLRTSRNIDANGGVVPSVAGAGLGGCGSLLEFGINQYHAIRARANGYGFTQTREVALRQINAIDHELAERNRLIGDAKEVGKEQSELFELEGKLLNDFRDLAVAEFQRYYLSESKTLAQQNSFYLLDAGANKAPSALSGAFNIHDILARATGFDTVVGVFGTISGAFLMFNPFFCRLYARVIEHHSKVVLERHGFGNLKYSRSVSLQEDYDRLERFCRNHQVYDRQEMRSLVARMEAYGADDNFIVGEIQRNATSIRRGNRTAIQGMAVGTVVGGSNMTGGILVNCASRYLDDTVRHFTLASIPYLERLPANTIAIGDNLRIQVGNELHRKALASSGKLSGQIIKQRFIDLDRMEKSIDAGGKSDGK